VIVAETGGFLRARQDAAHFGGNSHIFAGMTPPENSYNLQYLPLMMTV
jgi:hypothetical protein